jgi:hypothetical protein
LPTLFEAESTNEVGDRAAASTETRPGDDDTTATSESDAIVAEVVKMGKRVVVMVKKRSCGGSGGGSRGSDEVAVMMVVLLHCDHVDESFMHTYVVFSAPPHIPQLLSANNVCSHLILTSTGFVSEGVCCNKGKSW